MEQMLNLKFYAPFSQARVGEYFCKCGFIEILSNRDILIGFSVLATFHGAVTLDIIIFMQ